MAWRGLCLQYCFEHSIDSSMNPANCPDFLRLLHTFARSNIFHTLYRHVIRPQLADHHEIPNDHSTSQQIQDGHERRPCHQASQGLASGQGIALHQTSTRDPRNDIRRSHILEPLFLQICACKWYILYQIPRKGRWFSQAVSNQALDQYRPITPPQPSDSR